MPSNAEKPGLSAIWRSAAALRSPSVASSASQAESERVAAAAERVFARCFLLPALRPGLVLEVQDLPSGTAGGPWLVTQVTHRLFDARGETSFSGESAGGLGLRGALGAALGAFA